MNEAIFTPMHLHEPTILDRLGSGSFSGDIKRSLGTWG